MILTAGRTGSELLVSLLDSNPRIRCLPEILQDVKMFPNAYVSARATTARVRGFEAFGWKLALNQFRSLANLGGGLRGIGDPGQYPARLHAMGFELILSARRNPVQQALSGLRAMQQGFHHRRGDRVAFAPTAVDPVDLLTLTRILETHAELLAKMVDGVPHLRITYEDDLLDSARHQGTVDRVSEHIGVASAPTGSNLVKIAPRSLRHSVTNYDEIQELFRNTPYLRYLSEDEEALTPAAS